jgi:hypothetical protein
MHWSFGHHDSPQATNRPQMLPYHLDNTKHLKLLGSPLLSRRGSLSNMPRHEDSEAVRPPPFNGPHLWIHHDANNVKAQPHRNHVYSHIQSRYRPWKRYEDNKVLRASAKVPRYEDPEEWPLSPKTIMAKGNSDPFGVLAIKIGPEENDLISFYRDVFIPAQYEVQMRMPNLAKLRASDWEDCSSGLREVGIAHGSLARYGQIVGRSTPAFRKVTMEHHCQSTHILLNKVKRGLLLQDHDTYFHITMLFSSEIIARNLSGALTHGRILRHMFEEAWKLGTLDYKLLLYQLYNDAQLMAMFLVRPIWDPFKWLPMVFAPVWALAAPLLPHIEHTVDNIDPSITGALAEYLIELRKAWAISATREPEWQAAAQIPAVMASFLSKTYILAGRVTSLYVDVTERLRFRELTNALRSELLMQQYITLAIKYHTKVLSADPKVFGVPVFDARGSALPALRASLEASSQLVNDPHMRRNMNARLWALYVGAMSEHSWPTPGFDPHKAWFNTNLANQAIKMGLRTWQSVKHILLGFFYVEWMPPNGSNWFEKTLNVYLKGESLLAHILEANDTAHSGPGNHT